MIRKVINYFKGIFNLLFLSYKRGLYKYKNYDEYKQVQIEGNQSNLDKVWVSKENIDFLSKLIKKRVKNLKFGLCHGTRNGLEQKWFKKNLGIKVIGTEISPTAKNFPDTIEWDFHDVKKEWKNNVSFIYSNSLDHSYKPKECLDSWMSCIQEDGILILEWSNGHIESTKLDPFGGSLEDYKKLILKKYKIEEIIPAPSNKNFVRTLRKTYFIIISKK